MQTAGRSYQCLDSPLQLTGRTTFPSRREERLNFVERVPPPHGTLIEYDALGLTSPDQVILGHGKEKKA